MPVKFFGATDDDPGEWFTWREEGGERIEFLIRRLPPAESARIERQILGAKWEIRYRRKAAVQEFDRDRTQRVNRAKATYCLLDSRGFEAEPAGPAGAEELGKALGQPVEPGTVVSLDGRWTDPVKALMFERMPQIVDFVGTKALELEGEDAQDEEEASGN